MDGLLQFPEYLPVSRNDGRSTRRLTGATYGNARRRAMPTELVIHTFRLPIRQPDYRCGGCGGVYVPFEDGSMVEGNRPGKTEIVRLSADGYFHCAWCVDRRFRWEK